MNQKKNAKRRTKVKTICLGRSCNNNCVFCGAAGDYESLERLKDIIPEMKSGIREGITRLSIEGREPTILPCFLESLRIARLLGYNHIELISNGRLFSNSDFSRQAARYLDFVFFSIHSNSSESHDMLTRTPGSFSQSIGGIRQLQKIGFTNIGIRTVITKKNYTHLAGIVSKFSKMNITRFEFTSMIPIGNALKNYEELAPRLSESANHIQDALDLCREKSLQASIRFYPDCIIPQSSDFIKRISYPKMTRLSEHIEGCCELCRCNEECHGFWTIYLKIHGTEEFKPLA